jgi:redox-sensing transcriptional repressor
MAVLTVPANAAQETADLLVAAGIKSIWNFTPVKLITPNNVIVENQSLVWGLIALSFRAKSALL